MQMLWAPALIAAAAWWMLSALVGSLRRRASVAEPDAVTIPVHVGLGGTELKLRRVQSSAFELFAGSQ